MPLIGGGGSGAGGAGNPAGSNPAGTGNVLNYIGQYAYAYSGLVSVDNNITTVLKFDTGDQMLDAKFILNYASNLNHDEDFLWQVKLNDEIIMQTVIEGAKVTEPPQFVPLIIPAYSKVEFLADNISDADARTQAVLLTAVVPYA
jgi:hypothetical protein